MWNVSNGTLLEPAAGCEATAHKLRLRVAANQLTRTIARRAAAVVGSVLVGCAGSVPVRIASSGDWLMVPVRVNGVSTSFLVDTGATNSTVSNQFANRIGLWSEAIPLDVPIKTEPGQPIAGARYAPIESFQIGPIRGKHASGQVLIVDLSHVSALAGENVDGLVGNATLGSADYVLNVSRPSLELARNLKVSSSPQALQLRVAGYRTYLPATINGHSFDFLLDTGSNRTTVTSDVLSALAGVETEVVERTIVSVNRVETKSVQRFRAVVTLGSVSIPDFTVFVGDANLIGLDLLRFGELSVSVNERRFIFRSLTNELGTEDQWRCARR